MKRIMIIAGLMATIAFASCSGTKNGYGCHTGVAGRGYSQHTPHAQP
ncbi:MAG: hypothetical protein V4649_08205 [Bacteroidota bacterium]